MKKVVSSFVLALVVYNCAIAQNPYQVNTSATNIRSVKSDVWVAPLKYNTLKSGARFMLLPPVETSPPSLDFKTKNAGNDEKLLTKDFGGRIFVYTKFTDIISNNQNKRNYHFLCDGKEYILEEWIPEDNNKFVNWKQSGLVWLDEVDLVKKKLEGKTVWINADRWNYEQNGTNVAQFQPERFAEITILQVGTGEYSNYPLRVLFQSKDGKKYFVDGYVSGSLGSYFSSDNLSKLILFEDPESVYPKIKKQWWQAVKNRQIDNGMNEEACILSLGTPDSRDEYTLEKDVMTVLNYRKTMQRRYSLTIMLKNNEVVMINKFED